jgi:hypothetical protein
MKKVITVLVMMVISLSAFSQSVIYTNSSRVGTWDALIEKWRFDDWESNNITFTSTSTGVSVDDKTHSYYTFLSSRVKHTGTSKLKRTYTSFSWECLDESLRKCTFIITVYEKKDIKISIVYDNSALIEYTIF